MWNDDWRKELFSSMLTIKDRLLRFLLLLLYVNSAQCSVWQVQLHRTKIDGSLGAVTVRGLHTQFGVKRRRQCESQCSSRIELFPSSNHPLRFVKSVNELIGFRAEVDSHCCDHRNSTIRPSSVEIMNQKLTKHTQQKSPATKVTYLQFIDFTDHAISLTSSHVSVHIQKIIILFYLSSAVCTLTIFLYFLNVFYSCCLNV